MSHTAAGTERVQMDVEEKKPKINWPRASEAVKYRQFDDTMSEAVSRLREIQQVCRQRRVKRRG